MIISFLKNTEACFRPRGSGIPSEGTCACRCVPRQKSSHSLQIRGFRPGLLLLILTVPSHKIEILFLEVVCGSRIVFGATDTHAVRSNLYHVTFCWSTKDENDSWGQYNLCIDPRIETCIAIETSNGFFVLNYENEESTQQLYIMFSELLASKTDAIPDK